MIERIRYTIIGGRIPDKLSTKILLAITYISNLLYISSPNSPSLFQALVQSVPNLHSLGILRLIVMYLYMTRSNMQNPLNGHLVISMKY